MPVGVVDRLEAVEVDDEEGDPAAGAKSLCRFSGRQLVPPSLVEEARAGVGDDSLSSSARSLRVPPGVGRHSRQQGAALELQVGELVVAVAPDVEHPDALVARDERYDEKGFVPFRFPRYRCRFRMLGRLRAVVRLAAQEGPAGDAGAEGVAQLGQGLELASDEHAWLHPVPGPVRLEDRQPIERGHARHGLGQQLQHLCRGVGEKDDAPTR